jgi:hypothetical protein
MTPHDLILVVLVVALMILIAHHGRSWLDKTRRARCESSEYDYFTPRVAPTGAPAPVLYSPPAPDARPHVILHGHEAASFEASRMPERVAEAEREQWYASSEADRPGAFDTELAQNISSDTLQYHSEQPAIDYSGYIADLVIDPRTRENHSRWAKEMEPWAGTAKTVDNLDEALEASTHFVGLRRPQAIAQSNPLQLTEKDGSTFADNPKFNFRG